MTLQTQIANRIKLLFDYHEYEIKKENLIKLSKSFIEIDKNLSIDKFERFICKVEHGEYGVLYKMPTCILSMFHRFNDEPQNIVPKFSSGPGR